MTDSDNPPPSELDPPPSEPTKLSPSADATSEAPAEDATQPKALAERVGAAWTKYHPGTWPRHIRYLWKLLVTRGDPTTEEGRATERYRKAGITTLTTVIAKGLEAIVSLVSLPLTIGYLGKQRYGMWVAISALLTWGSLADFGLGKGLQNRLSEAYGKGDDDTAAKYVGTAFYSLSGIALFLGLLLGPAVFLLPFDQLLNIKSPTLRAEAPWAVFAVLMVFLLHFPLGIVGQIYAAYQRGYISNVFGIAGNVLSLGTLLVVIKLKLGLPWLIFARGGVSMVLTLVNLGYIVFDMPFLRPKIQNTTKTALRNLMSLSVPMFIFQIGALLINELQLLVLARVQGLSSVTDYHILRRVLGLPILAVSFLEGPLAPAFREAYAREDFKWFKSAFWRLQRLKIYLSVAGTIFFFMAGNSIAGALSNGKVQFGPTVWASTAVLLTVGLWNGGFNNLFVAIDRVWFLAFMVLLNGLVTAPLTYYFGKAFGIVGAINATTAFSLFVAAWLMPVVAMPMWRRIKGKSDKSAHFLGAWRCFTQPATISCRQRGEGF